MTHEDQSAYWADSSSRSAASTTVTRHLAVPGHHPSSAVNVPPSPSREKSKRSLFQRISDGLATDNNHQELQHSRSVSLQPSRWPDSSQALPKPPNSQQTWPTSLERSVSQPSPMRIRGIPERHPSPPGSYYDMSYADPGHSVHHPGPSSYSSRGMHHHHPHQQRRDPRYSFPPPVNNPAYPTPTPPAPQPSRPSIRRQRTSEDALENDADFSLFAAATTGLPPGCDFGMEDDSAPVPQFQRPAFPPPPPQLQQRHTIPIPPPQVIEPNDPPLPQLTHSFTYTQGETRRPSTSSALTPSQVFAESLQNLSDEEPPPDDELPNYAESQAEESRRRRDEATRRARELESRWRSARKFW